MPRTVMSQFLMVTSFVAIVFVLLQSEGCGSPRAMIDGLSFTSDDARIATTKVTYRIEHGQMRSLVADVGRTVSWLNAVDGTNLGIIYQDYRPGVRGLGIRLRGLLLPFRQPAQTCVVCNPINDHVALTSDDGREVIVNVDTEEPTRLSVPHEATNLAFSKSGQLLAVSGPNNITLINTEDGTMKSCIRADGSAFIDACLMSFSHDETRLAHAGMFGAYVSSVASGKLLTTVLDTGDRFEPGINAIAVAPDDTLVVCSENWVRRYGFVGQRFSAIAENGASFCAVTRDGSKIAIASSTEFKVYDLNSNEIVGSLSAGGISALAISSKGEQIAVGDSVGRVYLFDVATGKREWIADPPGRYRWSRILPMILLAVWGYFVWRFSLPKRTGERPSAFSGEPGGPT